MVACTYSVGNTNGLRKKKDRTRNRVRSNVNHTYPFMCRLPPPTGERQTDRNAGPEEPERKLLHRSLSGRLGRSISFLGHGSLGRTISFFGHRCSINLVAAAAVYWLAAILLLTAAAIVLAMMTATVARAATVLIAAAMAATVATMVMTTTATAASAAMSKETGRSRVLTAHQGDTD